MRRAALIELADTDEYLFSIYRRRDQLPFAGKSESERGWQKFTLQDAFLLRLMLDFIDGFGVGPSEARSFFRTAVAPYIHDAATADNDVWFGEIMNSSKELFPFHGTAAELAERISRTTSTSRVIVANASRAARFILSRAKELGLPEREA